MQIKLALACISATDRLSPTHDFASTYLIRASAFRSRSLRKVLIKPSLTPHTAGSWDNCGWVYRETKTKSIIIVRLWSGYCVTNHKCFILTSFINVCTTTAMSSVTWNKPLQKCTLHQQLLLKVILYTYIYLISVAHKTSKLQFKVKHDSQ